MRQPVSCELLEPREFLSRTVLPEPAIAVGPGTLYFNAVRTSNSSGPGSMQYQLRVTNAGSVRLLVSRMKLLGDDASDFQIVDFPAGGVSLAPGVQRNYTIQFNADNTLGVKNATLRIYSTDPHRKGLYNVPLRGLVTAGQGTTLEPSLQTVFNFFNFGIDAGEASHANDPYYVASGTSEAVDMQSLVKADPSQPVTMAPLALFTNAATPAVRMGYYTPGLLDSEKYLWYTPGDSAQSVAPSVYGLTKFDPGTQPFGLVTQYPAFANADASARNVYSENALNLTWDANPFTHMKFFPYKDANGNVVPNSYIVAEEEYENKNVYDNQDLIFIVRNVKPASAGPVLGYDNVLGYPSNDRLAFNKVQIPDQYVANITRTQNQLRVWNSGSADLHLSFGITGDYSIVSNGGSNITLAPGASRVVTVQFDATSTTGVHNGQLVITSDDPNKPTTTIALAGYWQQYSEQTPNGQVHLEPSAQMIVNQILGYQTVIGSNAALDNGGAVQMIGEEIPAEYFQLADTNAPMTVTEVATFHNQTYLASDGVTHVATNSNIAWYKQGTPNTWTNILTDKAGEGQMILSTLADGKTIANGVMNGSKSPGTQTFGFVVEPRSGPGTGEYSDHTLNPWPSDYPSTQHPPANYGQFLRFFPLRDADGVLVPNTYILLHDYNKSYSNFDFQDNIYIVRNIMPVGALKTPPTLYAESTSQGNRLYVTSPLDGPKVLGFNIYRSDTAGGTYALLNDTPLARKSSVSFTDTTALAGHTYFYKVTVVGNGNTESAPAMVKVN